MKFVVLVQPVGDIFCVVVYPFNYLSYQNKKMFWF